MTGKNTTSTSCRGSRPSWALVGAGCSNYIIAACTRAQTLPELALVLPATCAGGDFPVCCIREMYMYILHNSVRVYSYNYTYKSFWWCHDCPMQGWHSGLFWKCKPCFPQGSALAPLRLWMAGIHPGEDPYRTKNHRPYACAMPMMLMVHDYLWYYGHNHCIYRMFEIVHCPNVTSIYKYSI